MPSAPRVAVAVVSFETRTLLAACLRSLEPDHRSGLAEVWVVDNGSRDGSAALVEREFGWVRLVRAPGNLGFGGAVNLVGAQTTTPWLAIANADVEVGPGALARLVAAGDAEPGAGIVAPRLLLPDRTTQHSVHPFPTLPFTVGFNLGLARIAPGLGERWCVGRRWDPDRARQVPWAVGAFLLVRREAWDAVGGFDEGQWMYAEDLDLGWRTHRAGWATRYEPAARVEHRESTATAAAFGEERHLRRQLATYAWMLRRRGLVRTRAVALVNVAGAAVRAAMFGLLGRVRPDPWRHRAEAFAEWRRLHRRAGLAPAEELRRVR